MPEVITYSLRSNRKNSDEFFIDIAAFCDEVISHSQVVLNGILASFTQWGETRENLQKSRIEFQVFILLCMGILWQTHAPAAKESKSHTRQILTKLVSIRRNHPTLKPIADLIRGFLAGITSFNKPNTLAKPAFSLEIYDILLEWLQASGEYDEIAIHLKVWREYLSTRSRSEIKSILRDVEKLAYWFKDISVKRLGKYTENVNAFLENEHPKYGWREDNLFTGRTRVEYHLNMVGSELLNRILQADFRTTAEKVVILPPCMKAKPDDECQAIMTPFGERCMACTPSCKINQITRLGEKQGFKVTIIPDDLKVFSDRSDESRNFSSTGIIGVSCPLTNAQGGLEMIHLGVPAQGLPLDYCGCSYHWHKKGIPTDINIKQLLKILELN